MRIHIRRVRAAAVALLAALSLTLTASARTPSVRVDIENFARVNDAYFRGGSRWATITTIWPNSA